MPFKASDQLSLSACFCQTCVKLPAPHEQSSCKCGEGGVSGVCRALSGFLRVSLCSLPVLCHCGKSYDVPCQWFGIARNGNTWFWWTISSKYRQLYEGDWLSRFSSKINKDVLGRGWVVPTGYAPWYDYCCASRLHWTYWSNLELLLWHCGVGLSENWNAELVCDGV